MLSLLLLGVLRWMSSEDLTREKLGMEGTEAGRVVLGVTVMAVDGGMVRRSGRGGSRVGGVSGGRMMS